MVSIVAFQAMDPGSIPGRRTLFLSLIKLSDDSSLSFRPIATQKCLSHYDSLLLNLFNHYLKYESKDKLFVFNKNMKLYK